MSQGNQEHPLVLELENLKLAIQACTPNPEREEALRRVNSSIGYAKTILDRIEEQHERLISNAIKVSDIGLARTKGLPKFLGGLGD